ncbi:endolysin-like domain-containing protein [Parvibacter caecicola]|uniref:Uncharacterized protein YgiM (DUF1202 family) n=1 Tax=Parvibacter caecicola TaxID=747645 RepID=A0A7W5D325_9ACTN|nr:hypothetical protein [Parvibacter caecicola]MBB3171815.1 uncharacterized protein YgiM (DUF1202 family) [Parvibacter caecicola]MCR2040626.1 hypothetical protein [Parvibacter caecicola]
MVVQIAQASIDERGKGRGGKAGNQSGTELNIRAAYDANWHTLVVWKDAARGIRCANAAKGAVGNRHIGYDMDERNTILPLAEAAGWDLAKITTDCECDCSSLASVCAIAAGAEKAVMYAGGNLAYTGNLAERLEKTGLVTVHRGLTYAQMLAKATAGSIFVSNAHTVIVVSGATAAAPPQVMLPGTALTQAVADVIAGKYGNGQERREKLKAAGFDPDEVQAAVNRALTAEEPELPGAARDPADKYVCKTYVTKASALNVRTGPGTDSRKKAKAELTPDGQRHSNDEGQLLPGTRVTVSQVRRAGSDWWGLIPSGWIALEWHGAVYVK